METTELQQRMLAIEAKLNTPNTPALGVRVDRPAAVDTSIARLRALLATLAEQERRINAGANERAQGKALYVAQAREQAYPQVRGAAESTWQMAASFEAECNQDLQTAKSKQDGAWDYGRLSFLVAEIATRLSLAGTKGGGPLGGGGLQVIADLHERFCEESDLHGLRALRVAAWPFVQARIVSQDREAMRLGGLFRDEDRPTVSEEVTQLQAEQAALRRLRQSARSVVLEAERAVAKPGAALPQGDSAGLLGTGASPWRYEILGEGAGSMTDGQRTKQIAQFAGLGGYGPLG